LVSFEKEVFIIVVKIIFFESALELIPEPLRKHPLIRKEWKRNVKQKNRGILLDGAIHRSFMGSLDHVEKRGRPDIIHHSLLNMVYSPLFRNNKIRILIHTINDFYFEIPSDWRIPVNYNRFCGLISQLLLKQRVPITGEPLIIVESSSITHILDQFDDSEVFLCEEPKKREDKDLQYSSSIPQSSSGIYLIGGFQHGEANLSFLNTIRTRKKVKTISIFQETKPTWTIVSKLITLLELRDQIW
jgi:rRNA small subunit pseudouridine methyltransferase Nep1